MSRSNYQNLVAWKQARLLVRAVYERTDSFPGHELYGLTSQIRRAATSVPLNLAEGSGRWGITEWQQFLGYARGSLLEVECALVLAFDLGYATRAQLEPVGARVQEVIKMINGLLSASASVRYSKRKYSREL